MALYTCQNVIDAARRLIEEADDANVVTENQLIQFVSDCQIEVANETQCLQDSSSVTLAAANVSYTAPTGAESIIDVIYNYVDGYRSLVRIEPGVIPISADRDYPYFYYYRASKIWIFPAMTVLPNTSTVTVLFAKLPVAITATSDSLTIPDSFQVVVPYKVARLVALKDNQIQKAQDLQNIINAFYAGGITAISRISASAPMGGNAPAGS